MNAIYQDLTFLPQNYVNVYLEELPHFIVPWHHHPEIEIMYILEGIGTRFVGDNVEKYDEGDLCIIGANLFHEWRNADEFFNKESKLKASCLCLFFMPDFFGNDLINLPEMNQIKLLLEKSVRGVKFTGNSREKIGIQIKKYAKTTGAARVFNLIKLLDIMSKAEYELLASVGYTNHINIPHDFDRFNKIYKYIMENFSHPIRLEKISSLVGLTPNSFCRYFKEHTKKTFVQYLNDIRIGHSKKLLIEGRMTISTISMESGFNNLSNFIDQFKRSTKMLPSVYQKKFGVTTKRILIE